MLDQVGEQSFHVVTVALHKTSQTYGPANIVVPTERLPLLRNILLYNKVLSTDVQNESELHSDRGGDMFFVSSMGLSVSSSCINR